MDRDPDTLYGVYRDNNLITTFLSRERAQTEVDWQIEDDEADGEEVCVYRIVEFKQVK